LPAEVPASSVVDELPQSQPIDDAANSATSPEVKRTKWDDLTIRRGYREIMPRK
jgi:hypothetical protein